MKKLSILAFGAVLTVMQSAPIVVAEARVASHVVDGAWESSTGESRFHVVLCGEERTRLCAKLVWLREDMRTTINLKYLDTYVLLGALPRGPNSWQGPVRYAGETTMTNITAVTSNKLTLTGCKLMVCQTVEFKRM